MYVVCGEGRVPGACTCEILSLNHTGYDVTTGGVCLFICAEWLLFP